MWGGHREWVHIQIKVNQALRQDPWCTIKGTLNLTGRNSLAKFSAPFAVVKFTLYVHLSHIPRPLLFYVLQFALIWRQKSSEKKKNGKAWQHLSHDAMSGGGEVNVGGRVDIQNPYSTLASSASPLESNPDVHKIESIWQVRNLWFIACVFVVGHYPRPPYIYLSSRSLDRCSHNFPVSSLFHFCVLYWT